MNLGPHTITVVRPGSKPADYGSTPEPDWDAATRTDVTGCSVQPATADEYTIDRDSVTTRWQVWAPPATDALATDRIEWGGASYEVDGDVQRWDFGNLSHVTLLLRRSSDG